MPESCFIEESRLLLHVTLRAQTGWDYVLLIGPPAVMLLVNDRASLPRGLRVAAIAAIAVVAFSIYDVMGRPAYSFFMGLSVITVCVLVEIAALVTLRFRRAA